MYKTVRALVISFDIGSFRGKLLLDDGKTIIDFYLWSFYGRYSKDIPKPGRLVKAVFSQFGAKDCLLGVYDRDQKDVK